MKAEIVYRVRHTKPTQHDRFHRCHLVRNTTNEKGREYPAIRVAIFDDSAEAVFFREWLEKVPQ